LTRVAVGQTRAFLEQLYYDFRRDEVLRRRALGRTGRLAERADHDAAVSWLNHMLDGGVWPESTIAARRGYIHRGTNANGQLVIEPISPHADVNPDGVMPIEYVPLADFRKRYS
jgi:hypothetical protein